MRCVVSTSSGMSSVAVRFPLICVVGQIDFAVLSAADLTGRFFGTSRFSARTIFGHAIRTTRSLAGRGVRVFADVLNGLQVVIVRIEFAVLAVADVAFCFFYAGSLAARTFALYFVAASGTYFFMRSVAVRHEISV